MDNKITYKLERLKELEKELKYLQNHILIVGVLGKNEAGNMSNEIATVKEYAIYNEYGTISKKGKRQIPPRPFFRLAVMTQNSQKIIKEYMKSKIEKVINGEITGEQYLKSIGVFVVKRIRNQIKNYNWQPNSPSTLKYKTGNTPLMDTHSLYNSISYEIRSE